MRRRQFALSLLSIALVGGAVRPSLAQAPTTTVFVVRHAEKEAQPASDPALTAEGRARAEALAATLEHAGVTAVITTQFQRTRETAAPTVAEFHLTPELVPAKSNVGEHAREVAAAVMKHAGGTVLVVGHSNTVAAIVAALGAPRPAELCDAEYDALFVVTVKPDGSASVAKARYGKATPVPAGCENSMK